MSDKIMFKFYTNINEFEEIESRGYKKAVKSFQNKYPKLKWIPIKWIKNGVEVCIIQKLPMGRKKKLGG